ncbi:M23 family metallopeptidase [Alicyclobacillus fastidiosus]|uniref:M23 family metallopeptidase n=1 Tax=Alicyclobacillus fastidiosus TaxID=392011 RepID=A0ABV5AJS2_9BACL|nr:M23 family metallopeptidase [Alicyclobacillus fastidiosus]WEH08036.1 M23 family metallopeptidase [Alicyclobacillus fastidiosus]
MHGSRPMWMLMPMVAILASFALPVPFLQAATQAERKQTTLEPLYEEYADEYDVPWTLLAAIDRYAELTKTKVEHAEAPYYGYAFRPFTWSGIANPNPGDISPLTIDMFSGVGRDSDGDLLAVQWDEADRIQALAYWVHEEIVEDDDDEELAIWNLLQDTIAVDRVFAFSKIFETFGLEANGHSFPVSKQYNYSVKHSFGAGRSWGGRRVHEGVDIFADYGTPVLACSYGYVELKGWNRFGGWRVGIRDANNIYYYYAHLSSFSKGLKQGDLVRPGQVIGYVGSTGYGPPGTAGKFPPHLHFGIYKDTGSHEWAFSPSGYLIQWQRQKQTIWNPEHSSTGSNNS